MRRLQIAILSFLIVALTRAQAPPIPPSPEPAPEPEIAGALQRASDLMLAGSCREATSTLEPWAETPGPAADRVRLRLGLYAHACEQPVTATHWLSHRPQRPGRLEDWRLFLLSDTATATDRDDVAMTALTRLLADHRGSPLRQRALLRAARLAWEQEDAERALYLVRLARYEGVDGETGEELERLAWEIHGRTGDQEGRRETARQLLSHWPFAAAQLKVIELFRQPSGELPWSRILSRDQLMSRAGRLLEAQMAPNALDTLLQIEPAERDTAWRLLSARALIATGRAEEGLATLASVEPRTPDERIDLLWWRSRAARELARAGRRGALPASERERMRRLADESLRQIAELDTDRERTVAALTELFAQHADAGRFEEVVKALAWLRRLEPQDTTGDSYLWQLGWQAFEAGNASGAIGYWSELIALYPESVYARAGLYWSARAHSRLGETARARSLLREVVASPADDFYRRHALARLGAAEAPARDETAGLPVQPWPEDPALARAPELVAIGLPSLALSEIEARRGTVDPRAAAAAEARALAARGDLRDSIHRLIVAFPALMRPAQQHLVPLDARRMYYPLAHQDVVERYARLNGLDPLLILGIIRQESAFDAKAVSYAGARGLMQLMPATSRELAARFDLPWSLERLSDPEYSVQLGTAYYRQVRSMFDGNDELALAGYNGGPFRIKRLWQQANPGAELDRFVEGLEPDETRIYVKRILAHRGAYGALYPELG